MPYFKLTDKFLPALTLGMVTAITIGLSAGAQADKTTESKTVETKTVETKSVETTTKTNDLATRPVNEKILPLIKEGYSFIAKANYDKAIKVLNKALEEDSNCISARRYLTYALVQKGQAKEALAQMQTLSKLVTPNAFDFYLFAGAYLAAGGLKEAQDCYSEALRQNAGYDAARVGLVRTLAQEHKFEEALNNVQQGLQSATTDSLKKYYTALGKDVMDAQAFAQQGAVSPVSAIQQMPSQAPPTATVIK